MCAAALLWRFVAKFVFKPSRTCGQNNWHGVAQVRTKSRVAKLGFFINGGGSVRLRTARAAAEVINATISEVNVSRFAHKLFFWVVKKCQGRLPTPPTLDALDGSILSPAARVNNIREQNCDGYAKPQLGAHQNGFVSRFGRSSFSGILRCRGILRRWRWRVVQSDRWRCGQWYPLQNFHHNDFILLPESQRMRS